MKIIKDGSVERIEAFKKQVKEFECPKCGCVFEASVDEYKTFTIKKLFMDSIVDVQEIRATCPYCGLTVIKSKVAK